jgi:molybdate transport system regulatory protein
MVDDAKLTIRVDLGGGRGLGPGKIRLLEAIDKTGSISEAGRQLNTSFSRAWHMVSDLKKSFRARVVEPRRGGADGGGAALSPLGARLVELYHAIEADALSAASTHLRELETTLRHPARSLPIRPIRRVPRKTRDDSRS